MPKKSKLDKLFEKIAKEELFIDTLESRNMDSLDFHDLSRRGVKKALERAFEEGLVRGVTIANSH